MTSHTAHVGCTNQPWSIAPTSLSPHDLPRTQVLSFGKQEIALREVIHCRLHKESNWDIAGQNFNFMLYVGVAAVFLFLIVDAGWRIQFLIAVALLLSIAAMSLADVLTTRKIAYYRIELRTEGGRAHSYTTASGDDANAMLSALQTAGVRVI